MVQDLMTKSEIAYYRIRNRLENWLVPRNIGDRKDTFPFLSCDSYALRCHYAIPRHLAESDVHTRLKNIENFSSVYIPARHASRALSIFEENSSKFKKIILGDDDLTISTDILKELGQFSEKIYAINMRGANNLATALPIGLESPSYRSGGRLRDFKDLPRIDTASRVFSFLVAWNDSTNVLKRRLAKNAFLGVEQSFIASGRLPAQVVHRLMRKSLFVPCPSGNGLDTHRVWESIYLGAVPIIQKEDSFAAIRDWPVLIVDSWDEISGLTRRRLEDIYLSTDLLLEINK